MTVFADAFGVQFPVCDEKQKNDLEAAYKDLAKFVGENEQSLMEKKASQCMCDLLIALIKGTADRAEQSAAGVMIAQALLIQQSFSSVMTEELESSLSKMMGSAGGGKKEWVN